MSGDPFKAGNKVAEIIRETRKRKGMKEELSELDEYLDVRAGCWWGVGEDAGGGGVRVFGRM